MNCSVFRTSFTVADSDHLNKGMLVTVGLRKIRYVRRYSPANVFCFAEARCPGQFSNAPFTFGIEVDLFAL